MPCENDTLGSVWWVGNGAGYYSVEYFTKLKLDVPTNTVNVVLQFTVTLLIFWMMFGLNFICDTPFWFSTGFAPVQQVASILTTDDECYRLSFSHRMASTVDGWWCKLGRHKTFFHSRTFQLISSSLEGGENCDFSFHSAENTMGSVGRLSARFFDYLIRAHLRKARSELAPGQLCGLSCSSLPNWGNRSLKCTLQVMILRLVGNTSLLLHVCKLLLHGGDKQEIYYIHTDSLLWERGGTPFSGQTTTNLGSYSLFGFTLMQTTRPYQTLCRSIIIIIGSEP